MNKLDKKVIIDRTTLESLLILAKDYMKSLNNFKFSCISDTEKALAQDNTGWAAAPVEATAEMFERICEAGKSDDWDGIWPDALNASPPLPGGGE